MSLRLMSHGHQARCVRITPQSPHIFHAYVHRHCVSCPKGCRRCAEITGHDVHTKSPRYKKTGRMTQRRPYLTAPSLKSTALVGPACPSRNYSGMSRALGVTTAITTDALTTPPASFVVYWVLHMNFVLITWCLGGSPPPSGHHKSILFVTVN